MNENNFMRLFPIDDLLRKRDGYEWYRHETLSQFLERFFEKYPEFIGKVYPVVKIEYRMGELTVTNPNVPFNDFVKDGQYITVSLCKAYARIKQPIELNTKD